MTCAEVNEIFRNLCRSSCDESHPCRSSITRKSCFLMIVHYMIVQFMIGPNAFGQRSLKKGFNNFNWILRWLFFVNSILLLAFWVLRGLFCILSKLKYFEIGAFQNPFWLFLIAPAGERLKLDPNQLILKLTWLLKGIKACLSNEIIDQESGLNTYQTEFRLHRCCWRMLETKCVGQVEMLVTDLIHWENHQHNENSH